MRILQICCEFPPVPHGGIGAAARDLAPALAKRGVDLTVVGIYSQRALAAIEGNSSSIEIAVHRLASVAERLPFPLRAVAERVRLGVWLRREHRARPFDLVLTEDFDGWLPFFLGDRCNAPKLAVRLNGSNFVYDELLGRRGSRLLHRFERWMLEASDGWIGVSHFFFEETAKRIGRPRQVAIIPNPVDTSAFVPKAGEDLTVPGRIVFHNSLGARKGIEDLLDALPMVCASFPEAHLEVYGSRQEFESRRRELLSRLSDPYRSRVTFFGRVDRERTLPEALERAHVACYPSHLETFGIAPVEAMAMKRITVYTDTGPGREIIDEGVTGLLCPPRDPAKLADTLIRALKMPDTERLAMGEAARAAAVARFDREVVADRYLEFFQSLLDCP